MHFPGNLDVAHINASLAFRIPASFTCAMNIGLPVFILAAVPITFPNECAIPVCRRSACAPPNILFSLNPWCGYGTNLKKYPVPNASCNLLFTTCLELSNELCLICNVFFDINLTLYSNTDFLSPISNLLILCGGIALMYPFDLNLDFLV